MLCGLCGLSGHHLHTKAHHTHHFPFIATEEVILAEDRTSEEEKRHILNVRRRAAEKKRKLKQAGKSKSTDTEEESTYDYNQDEDGKTFAPSRRPFRHSIEFSKCPSQICQNQNRSATVPFGWPKSDFAFRSGIR